MRRWSRRWSCRTPTSRTLRRPRPSGRAYVVRRRRPHIVGAAASRLAYVMVPKVDGVADVARPPRRSTLPRRTRAAAVRSRPTESARGRGDRRASADRIVSFGLMDFVSAHRGAIPASAMSAAGQFAIRCGARQALDRRRCHASRRRLRTASSPSDRHGGRGRGARRPRASSATRALEHPPEPDPGRSSPPSCPRRTRRGGRAHPHGGQAAEWAPIGHAGILHDRASYRYFWRLLVSARRAGAPPAGPPWQRFFAGAPPREADPGHSGDPAVTQFRPGHNRG